MARPSLYEYDCCEYNQDELPDVPEAPMLGYRRQLVKFCLSIAVSVGAEIGVGVGGTSRLLLREFPSLTLHMVDSWSGGQLNQLHHDLRYQQAVESVKFFGRAEIHRQSSRLAVVPYGLDFVFLDASKAYPEVQDDMQGWLGHLREGGLLIGREYGEAFPDAARAVVDSGLAVQRDDYLWWVVR